MIQTINSSGSFKLGSGQLYFNYNTAAFGESISTAGAIEVTYPEAEGYICGQFVDVAEAAVYGSFVDNDNTTSRVSWAFAQVFSSSTFAADNVTDTQTKLAHIRVQYINVMEEPMFTFEDGAAFDDQFFTACGSSGGGPFDTADCTNFAGVQLVNDSFISGGATLSNGETNKLSGIGIYPNPAKDIINISSLHNNLKGVEVFNLNGQLLSKQQHNVEQIDISAISVGVYFLKLHLDTGHKTLKFIKH